MRLKIIGTKVLLNIEDYSRTLFMHVNTIIVEATIKNDLGTVRTSVYLRSSQWVLF